MRATYHQKEIVWGKIDSYPWWPGKIISMHIQSQEIVYKILFFADPTYAYLHESQLQPFATFDRNVNAIFPKNNILNKAIRMADQSYAKVKAMHLNAENEEEQEERLEVVPQNKKQSAERNKQQEDVVNSKSQEPQSHIEDDEQHEVEQNKEKLDRIRSQQTMVNMNNEKQFFEEEENYEQIEQIITIENVIDILECRMRSQKSFEYNYENRRNAIRQKKELKQKLLQRYNLHALVNLPVSQQNRNTVIKQRQITSSFINSRKKRHFIKRQKQNIMKNKEDIIKIQDKCLKKLYRFAKISLSSKMDNALLKSISINSIKKLGELSQNHPNMFQNMFINLIRFIERLKSRQIQEFDDMIINLNGYFERLQNDKNEQEEGSKMTQVSFPFY